MCLCIDLYGFMDLNVVVFLHKHQCPTYRSSSPKAFKLASVFASDFFGTFFIFVCCWLSIKLGQLNKKTDLNSNLSA